MSDTTPADAVAVQSRRPRRCRKLRRALLAIGLTVVVVSGALGGLVGYSIWRIDRAVHHVAIPASLLAKGRSDLLAIVAGPRGSEEAYLFHTTAKGTHVLEIPSGLDLRVHGHAVALKTLSVHHPVPIVTSLRRLGFPVNHYVGVDLRSVDPNSALGQLATGKVSVTHLISDPTGTASLLVSVASHVFLGPGTPPSALLALMHVPASKPVEVPTNHQSGRVVLAAGTPLVLRDFLHG
jgi:hypothetical protein